jgi:hypothetical protein
VASIKHSRQARVPIEVQQTDRGTQTDIAGHGTVIRRQALGNCTFEASFEGALDRHYLLCLASSGSWGGTLPELGTW